MSAETNEGHIKAETPLDQMRGMRENAPNTLGDDAHSLFKHVVEKAQKIEEGHLLQVAHALYMPELEEVVTQILALRPGERIGSHSDHKTREELVEMYQNVVTLLLAEENERDNLVEAANRLVKNGKGDLPGMHDIAGTLHTLTGLLYLLRLRTQQNPSPSALEQGLLGR